MEVFAQVKSFAFYHSTQDLYLSVVIIEKKLESDKKDFTEISKSDQISFKASDLNQIKKYLGILTTQDHVFISTGQVELGKDRNNKPSKKYIIDCIRECDVFKVSYLKLFNRNKIRLFRRNSKQMETTPPFFNVHQRKFWRGEN